MARRRTSRKTMYNDNNFAIAYYRYSSHSQNEMSIDQQRDAAHKYADEKGYKIIKEYEDAAISGTTDNRPGFKLMLAEVAKIGPHALIMWKADRLARDVDIASAARTLIRNAGCRVEYVAEPTPDDTPMGRYIERIGDANAELFVGSLAENILRGVTGNASRGLYNGHKVWGYNVDRATKKYVVDPDVGPIVQKVFAEYADGKSMQEICDWLNESGLRTTRGALFSVKTLNKILQNRRYVGVYEEAGYVIEDGMPRLIDDDTFERVQEKFAENKRGGARKAYSVSEDEPRYWLTGKLYCGECGSTMHGVSGTSKTGRTYYYYYCKNQRAKKCTKQQVRTDWLEGLVTEVLQSLVSDSARAASMAVDAYKKYSDEHHDTAVLDSLEARLKVVEKELSNAVDAVLKSLLSDTLQEKIQQKEVEKRGLEESIAAEKAKVLLLQDQASIQRYFDKYFASRFDDPTVCEEAYDYFIDKIYLYDDKLVIMSWYSEDKREITWGMLDGGESDPFVKGEAAEFDSFPFRSTSALRRPYPVGIRAFFMRWWRCGECGSAKPSPPSG